MCPTRFWTFGKPSRIRSNDVNYERCVRIAETITGPLVTCWPVLTEAAYLLRYDVRHVIALLRYISLGEVELADLPPKASDWAIDFFSRYSDHEPQLADAMLIYLAEQEELADVFTLDRRDFSIYRLTDGRALNILDA